MKDFLYDVFISYRRKGGSEKAQLVKTELTHRGVNNARIFLDTHSLHDGDFVQKIASAIENSRCILVIISDRCFDEIKETDYWYTEIKEALRQRKRIVPVFFDGINSFEGLNVPAELDALRHMNAVTYQHEYTEAVFNKLYLFIYPQASATLSPLRSKGCLFKYRSCVVSVTLVSLFLFVLVPMIWNRDFNTGQSVSINSKVNDAGIAGETGSIAGEEVVAAGATQTNATAHGDASMTIRDYYNHIYSLKIRRISVERDGRSFDPGISLSDVICGIAFVLSNGTLVTARQNIEPWIFWRQLGGKWRKLMAEYISLGCNVIIDYDAYSTKGTAHKLSFNNQDFLIDRSGDVITETIEISREVRVNLKDNGIELEGKNSKSSSISVFSPRSQCFALLRGKGGVGIPYDAGASLSSDGGTEVQVAGFKNDPDIHNLAAYISYFKSSTSRTDTQNGTIVLQDANSNAGYLGSPAFIKEEDGSYRVIGLMVGNLFGEDRIVPIARCNK
jgi:hypothetical protein